MEAEKGLLVGWWRLPRGDGGGAVADAGASAGAGAGAGAGGEADEGVSGEGGATVVDGLAGGVAVNSGDGVEGPRLSLRLELSGRSEGEVADLGSGSVASGQAGGGGGMGTAGGGVQGEGLGSARWEQGVGLMQRILDCASTKGGVGGGCLVDTEDVEAYKLFFLLPRLVVHQPVQKGVKQGVAQVIKERCARFLRGEWEGLHVEVPGDRRAVLAEADEERVLRDAVRLVKAGQLGKAAKRLELAKLAPATEETLLKLKQLHPAGTGRGQDVGEDRQRELREQALELDEKTTGCVLSGTGGYALVEFDGAEVVRQMKLRYSLAGLDQVATFFLDGSFGVLYLMVKNKDTSLCEKRRPVVPCFNAPDKMLQNRVGRALCFLIDQLDEQFNMAATQEICGRLSGFSSAIEAGDTVMAASFDVKEIYVSGIGIGGGASPGLAQCVCVFGEMQWTMSLGADRRLAGAKILGTRLMGDCNLLVAWDGDGDVERHGAMREIFSGYLHSCYPEGMPVELTSDGLTWVFCGMQLTVDTGGVSAKMVTKNEKAGADTGRVGGTAMEVGAVLGLHEGKKMRGLRAVALGWFTVWRAWDEP
eukprot:gene9962-biopygen10183